MHDIKSFLTSINFLDEDNVLQDVVIEKVKLNKKTEIFSVFLKSSKVLPFLIAKSLVHTTHKINGKYKCSVYISYENITDVDVITYLAEIIKELVNDKPSLVSLQDTLPIIDDDIIIF